MNNRKNTSKVLVLSIALTVSAFVLSSCASQKKMGCPGAISSADTISAENC